MSVTITISGTPISFPTSGTSPDWAPALVQFAQLVEEALSGVAGSFDVPPQSFTIDAYNPGTDIDITSLSFPVSDVRAATIPYAVYRSTDSTTVTEGGELFILYNPTYPVNNKWSIAQRKTDDASIVFTITDSGQVQFTTSTLAGSNHTGIITFSGRSILNE